MAIIAAVKQNLRMQIEETRAEILADKARLVQVFQNLVANAIKFRKEDPPKVRIPAVKEKNAWRFSVADNGIGMEPESRDRIFGMFQRLHSRRDYPGSGIGLAVCKKIVERHGGRIWVESTPGKGREFFFTIPFHPMGRESSEEPGKLAS